MAATAILLTQSELTALAEALGKGWLPGGPKRVAVEFLAGVDFGGEEGVYGKVSESLVRKTALSGC